MNAFDAHCTWEAVDGKDLRKTITWLDRKESSDIEDIIQAEHCLLLEASQNEPDCKLRLSCASPHSIRGVAVLCEARLMEVFGNHQEYLETVRGGVVDEMDDMIVYRGDIPFDSPVNECTVKFAALKNKSKMWLYGVVVKVQTNPDPLGRTRPAQKERIHPSYALAAQLLQQMVVSASPPPPLPLPPDVKTEDRGSQTEEVVVPQKKDAQSETEEEANPPQKMVEQPVTSRGDEMMRLAPELMERLSESISESVECSLEQMEQRLWAKMQQRIQEMEQRMTHHIQEIVDALKEEEDEDGEDEEGDGEESGVEEVAL